MTVQWGKSFPSEQKCTLRMWVMTQFHSASCMLSFFSCLSQCVQEYAAHIQDSSHWDAGFLLFSFAGPIAWNSLTPEKLNVVEFESKSTTYTAALRHCEESLSPSEATNQHTSPFAIRNLFLLVCYLSGVSVVSLGPLSEITGVNVWS